MKKDRNNELVINERFELIWQSWD